MVSIFNQATQTRKEPEDELPEWFLNAPNAVDEPTEELPDWFVSAPNAGPDPEHIEDEEITTVGQAMRVSGVEKPEDKLRIIREYFPDAVMHGDDNFIFTDPKTGKTYMFNQEGWWPSLNDIAASSPAAAEVTGAILGGIGGGTVGAAVGSPSGPGAVVPATAGAITGAGLGGASFREAMQDLIQWYNGDDDTRTNAEALEDFATNAAMSAAGEGIGRGVIAVGKPVVRSAKRVLTKSGPIDDAARAAFQEAEELGLKPTLGTITQNPKTIELEGRLAKDAPFGIVDKANRQLDTDIGSSIFKMATEISPVERSPHELGVLLRDAAKNAHTKEIARLRGMYDEFNQLAGSQKAIGSNLQTVLKELQVEKAQLGNASKMSKGPTLDAAIKHAKAISTDINKGIPLEDVRAFRTDINPLAYGKNETPYSKELYQRIYKAATDDALATARQVSDEAAGKMTSADEAYSLFKTSGAKKVLEKAINEKEPTAVFDFYSKQIAKKPDALKAVKDTLTKNGGDDAWNAFRAYHLRQLGQQSTKTGTEFNPSVFVKHIEKMAKESAETLFEPGYIADLKRLQSIAAKRAYAKGVRVDRPNILDQVIDATMNRYSFGALGKIKDKTIDAYRENLVTNPVMVREILGLQKKNVEKGFYKKTRDSLLDAAARAGELEAMRGILDSVEGKE